jgi:hypothetical protein
MPSPQKYGAHAAPIVDEWGIYDPDRAGLAAVLERLDARSQSVYRNDPNNLVSTVREVRAGELRTTD